MGALRITIAALFIIEGLLSFGCQSRSEKPELTFEAKPRQILKSLGILSSADPKLQVSSSGRLALLSLYGESNPSKLGLFFSDDGGDTFTHPVPVNQPDTKVHSHGENSPSLVYTPTEIYALWEQESTMGNTDLVVGRSLNFGHSFDPPVKVTDKTGQTFNGFSNLALAPDGNLYAVWLDGREKDSKIGTFSVYLARSTDHAQTFERNVLVGKDACPCCRPSIAFGAKGEIYVAWRKVFGTDIRDIVLSRSLDSGQTFEPDIRIAADNWRLAGCPDSGPAILNAGNRIYFAWYTESDPQKAGIKFTTSDDQGKTFQKARLISGRILDANHPTFAMLPNGTILLVFQGRDPSKNSGWSKTQIYGVNVLKYLQGDGPVVQVPSSGKSLSYPVIAPGGGNRLYFCWTETEDTGQRAVALLRSRSI